MANRPTDQLDPAKPTLSHAILNAQVCGVGAVSIPEFQTTLQLRGLALIPDSHTIFLLLRTACEARWGATRAFADKEFACANRP